MSTLLEPLRRADELVFRSPERLWLALPILLVLLLAPLAGRAATRPRAAAIALRAAILAALLAVLLDPALPATRTVEGRLLVLADVSPSVGGTGRNRAEALLREAPRPPPVLPFGAAPGAWLPPSPAPRLPPDPRPATDVAAALRSAHAAREPGRPLRVVLVGDGRATVPGTAEAAAALRRAGVELHALGVPDEPPEDPPPPLRVAGLVVPPPRERRDPFAVGARVRTTGARAAHARLFVDGVPRAARTVDLAAGEGTVTFPPLALAPGRYLVQVALESDATPEDNLAQEIVVVPATPRVLVVAASRRPTLIGEALAVQGFDVTTAAVDDAPDPDGFDLVVLLPDAPADAVEARAAAWIDFVTRGGGLWAVGGTEGDGLARLHGGTLAALLPLDVPPRPEPDPDPEPEPAPPDTEPEPARSVEEREADAFPITLCLLVDRSGSMRGEKIARAREAAVAAAAALTAKDRIAVVAFGDEPAVVLPPQPAGAPGRVRAGLRGLDAEGQTAMFGALVLGARLLEAETTAIRHLVLLSDGVATDHGPWRDVIRTMRADAVTLSTVGVGERFESRTLITFARWGGGRYYSADRPDQIPQVITLDTFRLLEARRERAREDDRPPDPPAEEPDTPPAEPEPPRGPEPPAPPPDPLPLRADPGAPREMLAGLDGPELPGVTAVETGTPRLAAWTAVRAGREPDGEGEAGVAVALYRRAGLGTVAAWTTDPEAPSNRALREHPDFARLVAQMARSVLPDARGEPIALEQLVEGRTLVLRVRGEDGRPRTDLAIDARLEDEPLPLTRRADRYEAPLDAREGHARLAVTVAGPAGPLLTRALVLPPDPPRELRETGIDRRALVRWTGSADRVDGPPAGVLSAPHRREPFERPVSLPFLLAAAILLPFDAWVRRRARSVSR